ncbi:MAG: YdcF family protein [Lachnospiraceae bacterium]|nr:YdcF family protein [Lachnospiraceae bacterium]
MKRNKNDRLIPFEQSRKVIYLDKRGKGARDREDIKKENPRVAAVVTLGILAAICLLYCLSIAFFMGYGSRFFLVWGGMAVVFGAGAILLSRRQWVELIPGWLRIAFVSCCIVMALCVCFVEGLILGKWNAKAEPGADYLVVLGAQWKNSGPSYVLKKRLDKALDYLQENPDTYVVVSGGQGSNEPISEAAGMKRYLAERGIAEERIRMEEQSTSTMENLTYSAMLFDKEQDHIVVVTNNFHMYRALGIAKKQGYAHVEGLSAGSYPGMIPNNLLREFGGVVKDWLVGNL